MEKQDEVGEVMWVAISNGRTSIRVGVVYAPQESKTNLEKLKIMYKGIKKQIQEAREKKTGSVPGR